MSTAYTTAMGLTTPAPIVNEGAGDLGGLTLAPGIYSFNTNVTIPSPGVTLDAGGNSNAVWVFQISGDLSIDASQSVTLSGGALPQNIFWVVLGNIGPYGVELLANSVFNGNILCATNIAMDNGAVLNGRALAQTAVTLIGNVVTEPGLATLTFTTGMTSDVSITGSLSAGFTIATNDVANTEHTLTLNLPTATPSLADNSYAFILTTPSNSAALFSYFAAKSSSGWTPAMETQIDNEINGASPFFYLNAASGSYTLVDNFKQTLASALGLSAPYNLTVDDDYPVGTYVYTGTLAAKNGATLPVTVTLIVTRVTHTITVNAGANGTITPATGTVNAGTTPTYTVTANTGYRVASVTVDGSAVTLTAGAYTFPAVTANHTIAATFAINTYTITVNAGANGTITPATATVNSGTTPTYTVTANSGYNVASVTVDGSAVTLTAGAYTFPAVTANHTIAASFAINTYTLTYTAGTGGTITGTSPQTVNYGASGTAVTAVPNAGYSFTGWSDGVTTAARTDINVGANISTTANFSLILVSTTIQTTPQVTITVTPTTTTPPVTTTTTTTTTTTVTGTGTVNVTNDVTASGEFIGPVTLSSADNNATINIPAGISGTTSDGQPLTSITVTKLSELPAPLPAGENIISTPYEFGPSGAQFSSPISMTFTYDPTKLASGVPETSLVIAYYSVSEGQWVTLGGVVDTVNHTITVQVNHFTAFAVITGVTTTTPTTMTSVTTPPTTTAVTTPTTTSTTGLAGWLIALIAVVAVIVIVVLVLAIVARRKK